MQKYKLRIVIGITILLFILTCLAISFKKFTTTPIVPANKPLSYTLKPGDTVLTVAQDLTKSDLIDRPEFLIALAYWMGVTKELKAGEYLFPPGTTPAQLLTDMATGKTHYQKFTLVEGWTFQQVLTALNNDERVQHLLINKSPIEISRIVNFPKINPEGLLMPSTYYFSTGTTDIALLQRAYRVMQKELNSQWENRQWDLPYQNSYEALIAASLIEKETRKPDERFLIAGVILNRLQIGMPLQIDSTIIYGLGQHYTGKLTTANMRADNAYNTYLHKGLPPTPIAMPGIDSIKAVLHPEKTKALYFVAKGNGEHQFSETFAEHNRAVETYQIKIIKPKMGTRVTNFNCNTLWYLSDSLRSLFPVSAPRFSNSVEIFLKDKCLFGLV